MKKVVMLTLVALFAFSAIASAETFSHPIYPGLNMIAPGLVPFDPDPLMVFKDSTGGDINIDLSLMRWDSVGKGYIAYDQWGDPTSYGGVLLGDGAWLVASDQVTWQYNGVQDGVPSDLTSPTTTMTDMWISLPVAGLTMFGHPFSHNVVLADCKMTDGTQTLTMDEARIAGWCDGTVMAWDSIGKGYITIFIDPWELDVELMSGNAYWITTTKDNLALIIPAYPPAP